MPNALLYQKLKCLGYSTRVSKVAETSNFNRRLRKMESRLNVCLRLKMVIYGSMKAKRVDKDGVEVLAYCEKCSKDSVELTA